MAHPNVASWRTEPPHWVRALESFAIPFICYSANGARAIVSRDAERLLATSVNGALGSQADRLAWAQLGAKCTNLDIREFVRASDVRGAIPGVILSVYLAGHRGDEFAAVIVFHAATSASPAIATGDARLTPRETEVASLIALGYSTKEIGAQLGISAHTARHHTERVFDKVGVRTRSAVAALLAPRHQNQTLLGGALEPLP